MGFGLGSMLQKMVSSMGASVRETTVENEGETVSKAWGRATA
jgi:hypothetical protein